DRTLNLSAAEDLVADLTRQYRFFPWHVEFPHIFPIGAGPSGWSGGFSCVIGNPPWEKVELKEQEFFAQRDPGITNSPNAAARKKMIAQLPETNPTLYAEFTSEQRKSSGWTHVLKETGRYPLTGQGRLNTYAVFAETARTVMAPRSRSGLALPTGIATDATTAPFFSDLVRNGEVVHVYGFRNNRGLFKNVGHGDVRFCLLTFTGPAASVAEAQFAFDLGLPSEVTDSSIVYGLTPQEITLVNPNTGTCPTFKPPLDAKITIGIYSHVPILWRDNPEENLYSLSLMQGLFNMATDSGLFHLTDEGDMLPLYEGKMIYHFDHRFGDYRNREEGRVDAVLPRTTPQQKKNPDFTVLPRYWLDRAEVDSRLAKRGWDKKWLFGWRDVARSSDERTMVCGILPRAAVGHKFPLVFPNSSADLLVANMSSFILDYVLRQKMAGTSVGFFLVKQLPLLPISAYGEWTEWIRSRVVELTYTAWDMEPFARDLGDDGPPFRWDEERRFVMRAELDALFFHLYGINRDNMNYIMETFSIVKRKDIQRYGTFRTKDLVIEIYDLISRTPVKSYQSLLTPPPGDGPRHSARLY
ncbi:MAG TPA: SAM-dependent DNA methyltransferase, partial [Chloroflexota bacterium]